MMRDLGKNGDLYYYFGIIKKLFVIMSVESSLSDELTGRSKISNFSFLETSFAIIGDSKNSVSIRKESV